jgi:ABC-type uncharacterized transport system substrate-binding protein
MLMNRAAFVVTLALGVLAAPIVLGAQQTGKVYRIGVLSPGAPPPGPLEAFREGLRDFGYMEGRTIVIEWRFAEGKNERLSGLAEELVRLKVDVIFAVNTPAAWAAKKADALFVSETMTPTARRQIVDFAAKNRQATMFMNRDYVAAGGLMSYAPDFSDAFRHAATYVDKILKGAKPADLPVEQPTKFDLVINLKTDKALGLTIPASPLQRADEIIQ